MRNVKSGFRPKLELLDDRLVPAVLLVDDDKAQRPNAGYTSIQAAVDAADPGDTVRVFAGTYREQVTVAKRVNIVSVQKLAAVITPPAGGLPAAGNGILVTVTGGASGVVVDGFWVRGTGTPAGNVYAGIGVGGGASAAVRDNLVTDIFAPSTQDGLGILVQEADAVVSGNTVARYQKAGIVAFGPGNVVVRGNTVAGSGPNTSVAQVGIQLSDGAAGQVSGNLVTGNVYTGPSVGDEAAGIVVFGAGPVSVSDNKLAGNQIGFAAEGQTAGLLVSGNRVSDSTVDGIRITDSQNALVLNNRVSDSDRYGIALTGTTTNTLVALNRVDGSGVYDLFDGTAPGSGNLFFLNRFRTRN